ncbi:MAG: hypothetical protein QJR03_10585 [Sphaerobacter sp.]|nr:hypothetical protein [Sphaerobacter sp.]
MTRLLLWIQWRQWVHTWAGPRQVLALIAIGLVALSAMAGFTALGYGVGRAGSLDVLRPLAALALPAVVILVILADLPQVYGQLYAARDVELLFTLPIPTRSIFLVKYAHTVVVGNLLTIPLILVPLVGYGIGAGVRAPYYPALVLIVGAVAAGAVAFCYLVTLALVRVLPRNRIAQVMGVVQALTGLVVGLGGQVFRFGDRLEGATDVLPMPPVWLPTTWGAIALERAARADPIGIALGLAVVAVSGALLLLSLTLVERGFRLGWVRLSEGAARKRPARRRATTGARLTGPTLAVAAKEMTMLRRDVREWMAFLPMLVLFGVSLFQLTLGDRAGLARENPTMAWLLAQGSLLAIVLFFGPSFAAGAFARDGLAAWVLRTAPLSGWQITLAKFLVSWSAMAAFVVAVDLIAALAFGWSLPMTAAGTGVVVVLLTGALALGMWTGTIGARYDPQHPHNRLRPGTGYLLLALSAVYLLVALVPALLTTIPVGLEPVLATAASDASGVAGLVARVLLAAVRLKIERTAVAVGLGVLWLLAIGLGVAALSLWRTARRVDAGVQIEILTRG